MSAIDEAVDRIFIPLLPHYHDKEKAVRNEIRGHISQAILHTLEAVRKEIHGKKCSVSYDQELGSVYYLGEEVDAILDTHIAKAKEE